MCMATGPRSRPGSCRRSLPSQRLEIIAAVEARIGSRSEGHQIACASVIGKVTRVLPKDWHANASPQATTPSGDCWPESGQTLLPGWRRAAAISASMTLAPASRCRGLRELVHSKERDRRIASARPGPRSMWNPSSVARGPSRRFGRPLSRRDDRSPESAAVPMGVDIRLVVFL